MSYTRVIPRDLFNEANLLKCYGQIYIEVERMSLPDPRAYVEIEHDGGAFYISQDECDGSLFIRNVRVYIKGHYLSLSRPLNSREPWPLWVNDVDNSGDFDPIEVFNEKGLFSDDFRALCQSLI